MVEIKELEESRNDELSHELKCLIDRVNKYFTSDEVRCKARYNIDKVIGNASKKSEECFNKHKKRGNNLFADGRYEEAIEEYSQAIIWATFPPESDNQIAFAFGNRSAALFKIGLISQCLRDIEIALKYGYPSDQRAKLIKRKELCLQAIQKEPKCSKNESQIYDRKIKISEQGKIVANCSLKNGDVILVEDAWCTALDKDYYFTHCYNCLAKIDAKTLFPCFGCSKIRFCCESCSLEAWNNGHKYECCFLDIWTTLFFEISTNPVQLAAKMILSTDLNRVIDSLRNKSEITDDYKLVLNLKDPEEKCADFSKSAALLLTYFGEFAKLPPRIEGRDLRDDTQVFGALLLKHLQQIQINSVPIIECDFGCAFKNETVKLFEEKRIGYGIYPNYNSIDHSCDPNSQITSFDGRKLILRAIKDIDENELISISLGVTYKSHSLKERSNYLRKNYFFECKCIACTADYQSKCHAYLCPECKYAVNVGQENCPQCAKLLEDQQTIDSEVRQAMTRARSGALQLVYKEPDLRKAEHLLVESYRELFEILCPLNKKIGFVCDKLSLCYKLMRKYHLSLRFAAESIECVREEFGAFNFTYLNSLVKLVDRQKCFLSYSLSKHKEMNEKKEMLAKTNEQFKRDASEARRLVNLLTIRDSEHFNCHFQVLDEHDKCAEEYNLILSLQ